MFYENFIIGSLFESSDQRLVTSEDILKFAELTGDTSQLHIDEEFAKKTRFEGTIAHGLFTLGIAVGQWYSMNLARDSIIAFVGIDNLSFKSPVRPGDRIHLVSRTFSKRESKSNPEAGLVTFEDQMLNQNGTVVLEYQRMLLLRKKMRGAT
ncbi:MAG: MaoC family dehydratase [Nitrososphaerales archaeon]